MAECSLLDLLARLDENKNTPSWQFQFLQHFQFPSVQGMLRKHRGSLNLSVSSTHGRSLSLGNVITFEEVFDNQFNPSYQTRQGWCALVNHQGMENWPWVGQQQPNLPKLPPASAVNSQRCENGWKSCCDMILEGMVPSGQTIKTCLATVPKWW